MEPITKIDTQQIYPQQRKSRIVAESSSSSGNSSGSSEANGGIEQREENRALAESENNLPISSTREDIIDEEDPFLIVSLRASKSSPSRPRSISYLHIIALLDLSIITVCTILLVHKDEQGNWHWKKAAWDWVALGLIRFIAVVGIASSKWIRELRWVLGGVCCFSSLYIIFKANLIFQEKRPIDKYRLILLISSFLFCQIHWIAYVVVTTDNRYKAKFLRNQSVYFEEESNVSGDPPILRSYGATA